VSTHRLVAGWLSLALAALLLAQSHSTSAQTLQASSFAAQPALTPEAAGDVYFARGRYVEAIDVWSRAPYEAATLNKIGVAWHHLYAIGQARKSYEEALALRPAFPEALNNLGASWFAQKDYRQAIRLYRRALKLDPTSAPFVANLGTAYFAVRRPTQGLEAYRSAYALDPTVFDVDSPRVVSGPITDSDRAQKDYSLAELFAQMQNPDRALDYLRKAFSAGFADRKRLWHDPAFAALRLTPEFAALMGELNLK
jgi:tetratricopeptide (TPR) repeat protein